MKDMKATFDLTRLTKRQLKNIKKYYQKLDFSGYGDETPTKHIAQDVWNRHGINDHPHMKDNYDSIEVRNFPCNHQIWKDVQQYLVMCKLADTSIYSIQTDAVNRNLDSVKEIIVSGSDEPTTQSFQQHQVSWEWRRANEHKHKPENCVLSKLSKIITNTMVPMSDINPGIMEIDSMIDGNTTEYTQTYIGEK
jgi:hypothetical protein|tara:strand:+ start:64 stop:642 length:579 start_codon:yes stop_codon:yes gene_type:complete